MNLELAQLAVDAHEALKDAEDRLARALVVEGTSGDEIMAAVEALSAARTLHAFHWHNWRKERWGDDYDVPDPARH